MIGVGINWWKQGSASTNDPFAPINRIAPVVSGVEEVTFTLTTTDGDFVANPAVTYSYQWKSTDGMSTNNIGTDQNTFVLTQAEGNLYVYCTVTATNTQGSTSKDSNQVGLIDPGPLPILLTAPKALPNGVETSDPPVEDGTIVADNGTWLNDPTFTYEWFASNGADSDGSTMGLTNQTQALDRDFVTGSVSIAASQTPYLYCVVTATNDFGVIVARSDNTSFSPRENTDSLRYRPISTGSPTAGGTAQTQQVATVGTDSIYISNPTISGYNYQWQVSPDGMGSWSAASNASDASSYTIWWNQSGEYLQCLVTATNSVGEGDTVPSNVLGPIVTDNFAYGPFQSASELFSASAIIPNVTVKLYAAGAAGVAGLGSSGGGGGSYAETLITLQETGITFTIDNSESNYCAATDDIDVQCRAYNATGATGGDGSINVGNVYTANGGNGGAGNGINCGGGGGSAASLGVPGGAGDSFNGTTPALGAPTTGGNGGAGGDGGTTTVAATNGTIFGGGGGGNGITDPGQGEPGAGYLSFTN